MQENRRARLLVRDECREIRNRLRASRRHVPGYLDDAVAGRRGVKAADQLHALAHVMLDGGYSLAEARETLAHMAAGIADTTAAQLRAS